MISVRLLPELHDKTPTVLRQMLIW